MWGKASLFSSSHRPKHLKLRSKINRARSIGDYPSARELLRKYAKEVPNSGYEQTVLAECMLDAGGEAGLQQALHHIDLAGKLHCEPQDLVENRILRGIVGTCAGDHSGSLVFLEGLEEATVRIFNTHGAEEEDRVETYYRMRLFISAYAAKLSALQSLGKIEEIEVCSRALVEFVRSERKNLLDILEEEDTIKGCLDHLMLLRMLRGVLMRPFMVSSGRGEICEMIDSLESVLLSCHFQLGSSFRRIVRASFTRLVCAGALMQHEAAPSRGLLVEGAQKKNLSRAVELAVSIAMKEDDAAEADMMDECSDHDVVSDGPSLLPCPVDELAMLTCSLDVCPPSLAELKCAETSWQSSVQIAPSVSTVLLLVVGVLTLTLKMESLSLEHDLRGHPEVQTEDPEGFNSKNKVYISKLMYVKACYHRPRDVGKGLEVARALLEEGGAARVKALEAVVVGNLLRLKQGMLPCSNAPGGCLAHVEEKRKVCGESVKLLEEAQGLEPMDVKLRVLEALALALSDQGTRSSHLMLWIKRSRHLQLLLAEALGPLVLWAQVLHVKLLTASMQRPQALKLLFDVIHRASRQDLVLARDSTSSQDALVHFQRLLQDVEAGRGGCNVQTAGLWVACAETYVLERELEHATTTIAIAKRLSPFLPDVAFLQVGREEGVQEQGLIAKELGKPDAALEYFNKTIALDPQHVRALVQIAEMQTKESPREAADLLRRAVASDSSVSSSWKLLGHSLREMGDEEGGRECFQRYMELERISVPVSFLQFPVQFGS
ncbi:hypothetical protein GUITHDRAFT_142613 [Guillardia theta CCMP2712]|uniref:Uncharacterized protein n=1 Tax=Guillardia theta (strain CCMP2712) TaxID=905079 RepID=L1IWY8_GUITC|nr:hypothetical protein GUITHDRAFT_142613 [Guillardia theta CCMP2712]EKX40751.1 hypothetical protein GUITHDRAFT_142613 [Guillardia theta CCMP2712]|eukprot:XP_005827731.1 hypothetical protein GUITHDRAFT_142613 [Guillardia theta CCMP2712]